MIELTDILKTIKDLEENLWTEARTTLESISRKSFSFYKDLVYITINYYLQKDQFSYSCHLFLDRKPISFVALCSEKTDFLSKIEGLINNINTKY